MTETIWVHARPPSDPAAVAELLDLLEQNRPGLTLVATGEAVAGDRRAIPGPGVGRGAIRAFLDRHAPSAVLLTGPADSAITDELERKKLRAIWADAVLPKPRRWSLLQRGAADPLPAAIAAVLTEPGPEADRLARDPDMGGRIETPGYLRPTPPTLPCRNAQRDQIAQKLVGRPVWFAAEPAPAEVRDVLEAQKLAARLSHRLLLVLAAPPEACGHIVALATAERWHTTLHSESGPPDPDVQVHVVDDLDRIGLWYRLASISFLGGSLSGDHPPRRPIEPAALGSAVLHGPMMGPWADEAAALDAAGAARQVSTGAELGRAVTQLLSPDVSAAMAMAAWEHVTAGAPVMNRVAALVEELLDGARR